MSKCIVTILMVLVFTGFTLAQDVDAEGCKDYPLFNRMPNFTLDNCEQKEFDAYQFVMENSTEETARKETVEGKYYYYYYHVKEGVAEPSPLQIFRNFENALRQVRATIVGKVVEQGNSYSFICAKVTRDDREVWVRIEASGPEYHLTIVEREPMLQVIQANAMLEALNREGFIALNILFDTGKSTIKPVSQPIIDEIHKLLQSHTDLKVSIEGHTDNVGNAADNKTLSLARARAVTDALIAKGIEKERIGSAGFGQERPVADNRTEEGRAKNRRVEIVKK